MRIFGVALITFVALLASTAAGASDLEVLRGFGVLGTLAVDCSAPYSESNPYMTYAVTPQGQATRTLRQSDTMNATLAIRYVHMAGPDLLEYDETGRSSELTETLAKIAGKFRPWRTVRTSGPEKGAVLIGDGKFTSNGNATLTFTFCHAE